MRELTSEEIHEARHSEGPPKFMVLSRALMMAEAYLSLRREVEAKALAIETYDYGHLTRDGKVWKATRMQCAKELREILAALPHEPTKGAMT